MGKETLKFKDNLLYMQGIITSVTDGGVQIDLKGRLGSMSLPMRMLITDYDLKPGLTIGFMMSHPEVESDGIDETYRKTRAKEENV